MSEQIPFIPVLSLQEQSEPQASEQLYDEEGFISLLQQLSDRSVLYYCPFDRAALRSFYLQIAQRHHAHRLPLALLHQFISELKQRNRNELTREANYYEAIMAGHLRNGIQAISRKELRKAMDRYEGATQVITQIMLESSKDAEYVSCALVLELLQQVRTELEDAVIPELSITKLKTMRLDSEREGKEEGERVLPMFEEIGEYEVKRLLEQYGCIVRRKLAFYRQFIVDEEVLQDVDELMADLPPFENAIANEIDETIEANNNLSRRCEEFNGVLANVEAERTLQAEITENLKAQIGQIRQELVLSENRNAQLESIIVELETAVGTVQGSLGEMGEHCQELEQQLGVYRRNYEEIYGQYCKLVQESKAKSMLSREEENKKIFSTRSLKQQLEDTAHRLKKVLTEREKERKAFHEKEEHNINHIDQLEARVKQLELELKEKNEYLSNYIRETHINASKISLRMSKISASRSIASIIQENNNREEERRSNANRESIVSNVSSIEASRRFSRINRVNLEAVVPIIEEENSVEDISEVYNEQNVVEVIREDIEEQPLEGAFKKKNAEISPIGEKNNFPLKGKYFFSKGVQMNVYGRKFETFLLLTAKRFCYFDTKVRLQRYLPIDHIKEFTFVTDNPNIFIIKPTNTESLISNKHIVNDMIFSTRNASRLQACIAHLRQSRRVAVTVRKADNAWLRFNQNDYNLGMGVPSFANPFRLALAPQPVFYAQVKEDGLFASKYNAILIVQPIGIICFDGEEPYEMEQRRELICLLPLSQHLRLVDKKNSKQAPDKKLVVQYGKQWEKYYQIIFQSKDDMKRFKRAVQEQLEKNKELREQRRLKIVKMFPPQ